ncbi:copper homeostasis protein CutC [Paucisalibacillus globulus]|uniref:copper homeostasis protein CutC n=1 Tax=Paucisalibacillus globulus TaxID=351095 RepID=UPI0004041205|nr:copper homeostasis protein CutC [Paucisalibacillus globulus]
MLEIIATNLTDVKDAERYGADRIELSPAMSELGITPSYGLIQAAVESVRIPINVIIRPHSQSFVYNADDLEVMKRDIKMVKKLGANGIVVGALTKEGAVDIEFISNLLEVADGLEVTIHRAFDFSRNQIEALESLKQVPEITTILTAGGNYNAPEAVEQINELIDMASRTHLSIMVGHGLRVDSFEKFFQSTKPDFVHFGSGARKNDSFDYGLDETKIKTIKEIIAST